MANSTFQAWFLVLHTSCFLLVILATTAVWSGDTPFEPPDIKDNSTSKSRSFYLSTDTPALLMDVQGQDADEQNSSVDFDDIQIVDHIEHDRHPMDQQEQRTDHVVTEENRWFQRMLHMPSISSASRVKPFSQEVAPEYMHALYYTVDSVTKPLHVVSKDFATKDDGLEEVVWGIKAFHVRCRGASFIEALFHVSLDYVPNINFKIELVLENKLRPNSVRKAERANRNRQLRYSVETCNTLDRHTTHTGGHSIGNRATQQERSVTSTLNVTAMPGSSVNDSSITEPYTTVGIMQTGDFDMEDERVADSGEPRSHSPTGDKEIDIDQQLPVNKSLMVNKPKTGTTHCAANKTLQLDEPDRLNNCFESPIARQHHFAGRNHEYEVFDATRSFVLWWANCSSYQKRLQNINASAACVASVRLIRTPAIKDSKEADFRGDALLIIYKNVAADLVRTRRALKHGPSSRASVPGRSFSKRNGNTTNAENRGQLDDTMNKRETKKSNPATKDGKNSNLTAKHNVKSSSIANVSSSLCHLHKWHINFEEMGWLWIIAPMTFEANYCAGSCEVGINDFDRLSFTNNAFMRNVYRLFSTDNNRVPASSCVPVRTSAMNILYRSDDETIVLRRVSEITAERCGCR